MDNQRYSTEKEIKKVLCEEGNGVGGAVLYREDGKNYLLGGEQHCVYVGVSGSGKTRSGTLPLTRSIIEAGESAIVVDPKGDLYYETSEYARDKGYTVRVINMRDVFGSNSVNFLWYPYQLYISGDARKKEVAEELVNNIADSLFPINREDPFWQFSARSVFVGAALALFESGREDEINMTSLYNLIASGDKRFSSSTYLSELAEIQENPVSKIQLHGYLNTASETKGSIRANFLQGISVFSQTEGMMGFGSIDDLYIEDFDGNGKVMIYIIMPDETNVFSAQCGLLISQLMTHFIRIAHEKHGGRLPVRLNLILEELFSIGSAIPSLPQILSTARSRNIRVHYVLQTLSQLTDLYGESNAQTIIGNTDAIIAFRANNWQTLTYLSQMCGERMIEYNGTFVKDALITPAQLAAMKTGQALVLVSGRTKFVTWLPDYTEMFDCSNRKSPETLHSRENLKTPVFDIEEYVKEKKRQKMLSELESDPVRNICRRGPHREDDSFIGESFNDFLERQMRDIDERIRELDEIEAQKQKNKKNKKEKPLED